MEEWRGLVVFMEKGRMVDDALEILELELRAKFKLNFGGAWGNEAREATICVFEFLEVLGHLLLDL